MLAIRNPYQILRRPASRQAIATAVVLTALCTLSWLRRKTFELAQTNDNASLPMEPTDKAKGAGVFTIDKYESSNYLRGEPTENFRDNLLPDHQYITSWISAGWTNDVMTYMNLIYLGVLTNRIPILPMFTPSHIGGSVPPINFGEVFDIQRLRTEMKHPLVEWYEVKNYSAGAVQEIGCWNIWEVVQEQEMFPRRSSVPDHLGLDISYTKVPSWIKVIPRYKHDLYANFASLSVLAFPEGREEYAIEPKESSQSHGKLPPDDHLLCYDYLYYVCAHQPYELEYDYSPVWLFVGKYMHWAPRLENLATQYVRRALKIDTAEETPPWIAIHMRRGDFSNWCGDELLDNCFASISVIERRVEEVKQELQHGKNIDVKCVIMTSDEKDTVWWQAVLAKGWYRVDSSDAAELYGAWYPLLIDAVIQSAGVGFIGTDRSTMSLLGRRRVQSWQDGVVRTIKWGKQRADDH